MKLMGTKQTAVDWLAERYNLRATSPGIKQAKQMEKEQIMKANFDGFVDGVHFTHDTEITTSEEYYNETYGTK